MIKGVDYIGVAVAFYCHDGKGNYLFHKRSNQCRDEHGRWDCGGGGVKFGERLLDTVRREISEEFGVDSILVEYLGVDEVFRENEGKMTHWMDFKYRVLVDREKVINNEPHKHDELGWYILDALPSPLHSQVLHEITIYKDKLT